MFRPEIDAATKASLDKFTSELASAAPKRTITLPFSPEDVAAGRVKDGWDRWYGSLPADLKRKLSIHDFKRLGDCFKSAFNIP